MTSRTELLEIKVSPAKTAAEPFRQMIHVDASMLSNPGSRLHADLTNLPFEIPVTRHGSDLWEVSFPANVIQILAGDKGRAVYFGTLQIDNLLVDRDVPMKIVVTPPPQRGRPAGKRISRGRKAASAG